MTVLRTCPFDDGFYEGTTEASLESARVVVPMLLNLVQPRSVIDFGCGLGAWLRIFQENGVEAVRGLDGPWIDSSKMLIAPANFQLTDLRRPIQPPGHYDLALCLEVVEHLPYRSAKRLVGTLTATAPLILFSAAIPGQGGTCHINEQWPFYWRSEFRRHGFVRLDAVRPRILGEKRVSWWYRQNILLYAASDVITVSPSLRAEQERLVGERLEVITEDVLRRYASLPSMLPEIARASMRALQKRLYRLLERCGDGR